MLETSTSRTTGGHFEPTLGHRDRLGIRDPGAGSGRHYHHCDYRITTVSRGLPKRHCLSKGEFKLMAGNFVVHTPQRAADFTTYSAETGIFALTSPASHHAIDV